MKETQERDFAAEVASVLNLPSGSAKSFTIAEQQALYAAAFALYEQSNYPKAAELFTQLVLSAPFCAKYWMGLASSRQMEQEYMAALHAWAIVALLQERDPLPHFHAAECYLSLNEKQEALKGLQAAQDLLSSSQEDQQLAGKIELLRTSYVTS